MYIFVYTCILICPGEVENVIACDEFVAEVGVKERMRDCDCENKKVTQLLEKEQQRLQV